MRDVSRKFRTLRTASARSVLHLSEATVACIQAGNVPKGDPLPVARVAAIQAAKETSRIIPYCHPLPIESVAVAYDVAARAITVDVTVKAIARTGVEMEALTAASVAVLTLYDMLKMLDDEMSIGTTTLTSKQGGKSDFDRWVGRQPRRAAVLVMSDSIAAGRKSDRAGRLIADKLEAEGLNVTDFKIIPDERRLICEQLKLYADTQQLDLVITTGGTGVGPRDVTPEAMAEVIEREVPGIPEATRSFGQERTPFSMLSRGRAGIRGGTLIVNLPGSTAGVRDSLDALLPGLMHAFKMLHGGGHDAAGDAGEPR